MKFAVYTSLLLLLCLAIFQLMLVFGAPIGDYAWGGYYEVLPTKLRIASLSSIAIYLLFAVIIISKSGLKPIITNTRVVNIGFWIVTIYSSLGVLVNLASRNYHERYTMTLVSLLLSVSCWTILVVSKKSH